MSRPALSQPRQRLTVSVDRDTIRVIKEIRKTVPEIEGPSAAIRFLARHYLLARRTLNPAAEAKSP